LFRGLYQHAVTHNDQFLQFIIGGYFHTCITKKLAAANLA
jgi:hypothetical protein